MDATPATDGYYLPPRWAQAAHCWLAWPCRIEAWGGHYEHACLAVAETARTISEYLPVEMLVPPALAPMAQLQLAGKTVLTAVELNDSFPGDYGPLFLRDGEGSLAGAVFAFNGWGNAYSDYRHDEALGTIRNRI